jgi:adenine deaminase
MSHFSITGNIVNIKSSEIFWGTVQIEGEKIISITKEGEFKQGEKYILPGFIDSHVHIESSMLVPSEFAKLAVVHGTVGTISDPHEIANVCGIEGVRYMIENSKTVPFKCTFGAPSCVPATIFETAGAILNANDVDQLLQLPEIKYLSEVMNFPGVLNGDEELMKKIASAKKHNKVIDGHAPGLMGEDAKKYIDAGISTDHECFTAEEALNKLNYGMKILIREGSAAKNFDALIHLMHEHSDMMMFCSDDKHPDSLAEGHINKLCARAVKYGIDIFKVLIAACINPVEHYKMDVGLLKEKDAADFIVVKDLVDFEVVQTFINGMLVAENGKSLIKTTPASIINQFDCVEKSISDFEIIFKGEENIHVIEALDGQLITNKLLVAPKVVENKIVSNLENDILKIVVVNRYKNAPIAKSFIKNIGINKGALASSVAHDSHNIVAVGVDDESICKAVNAIIQSGGGVSAVDENQIKLLKLPVAGLMSNEDGYVVADAYTEIDLFSKQELGSHLSSPFMTLSFMALLVIPHLKISDLGLFDGENFELKTISTL